MTRQNLVANLIYLFLTNVQVVLFSPLLVAAPNIDPVVSPSIVDEPTSTAIDESKKESMAISEPGSQLPALAKPLFQSSPLPTSLTLVTYIGPYGEDKSTTNFMYGLDIEVPVNPSEKYHLGFLISAKPNPMISVSHELYLRNIWKYLKSWNYKLNLEVDSAQGLGSLLSLNHYMGGVGLTLSLYDRWFCQFEAFAISTRGFASEIAISYLLF